MRSTKCHPLPAGLPAADTAAEGHDLLVMQVVYDDDGSGKPAAAAAATMSTRSPA
jgi:hypothetical protein